MFSMFWEFIQLEQEKKYHLCNKKKNKNNKVKSICLKIKKLQFVIVCLRFEYCVYKKTNKNYFFKTNNYFLQQQQQQK